MTDDRMALIELIEKGADSECRLAAAAAGLHRRRGVIDILLTGAIAKWAIFAPVFACPIHDAAPNEPSATSGPMPAHQPA